MSERRPKTRADCPPRVDGVRVCPWVGCRYHLGIDVDTHGRMRVLHEPPWEADPCCVLDVADERECSLEEIAKLLGGLSRERIRQHQVIGQRKIRAALVRADLGEGDILDWLDENDAARSAADPIDGEGVVAEKWKPSRKTGDAFEHGPGQRILERMRDAISEHPGATVSEAAKLCGIGYRYAGAVLHYGVQQGVLRRVSRGIYEVAV